MNVLAADTISRFRALLGQKLGLAFEEQRLGQLAEVFEARVASHGGDAEAYLDWLASEPASDELGRIARDVTVPETYFFRHAPQFEALRAILIRNHSSAPPRILSAGCASGEEAYSLAMTLRELWPDREPKVVAADVNPAILERARAARYSPWSLRETPEHCVARWFRQEGRAFVLDDSIRRSVRFVRANLATDETELLPPDSYDVIFCRNMLMYFTPENFRAAVQRLARALVPEGHLFLGSAETLRGMSHEFHLCHTHEAFYYRRKSARELVASIPPTAADRSWRQPPSEMDPAAWVEEIGRAAARIAALTDEPAKDAVRAAPRQRETKIEGKAEGKVVREQGSDGGKAAARGKPGAPASDPARARVAPDRARLDLSAALDLLHKEQFSDALDQVRALPDHATTDPEAMLLEAVLLASAGRFDDAERACQRLLALDELNAGANYVLALCSAGGGRLERAVHYDRVATYLDPAFAMPRLHLGLMLRREGERVRAREELVHARSLLEREDAARLLMFGGGFNRHALLALCDAELELANGTPARGVRAARGGA